MLRRIVFLALLTSLVGATARISSAMIPTDPNPICVQFPCQEPETVPVEEPPFTLSQTPETPDTIEPLPWYVTWFDNWIN
jgi:hypothetical protein